MMSLDVTSRGGALQALKDTAHSLEKWDPLNWAERGQHHLHPRSLGHQSLSLPHTGRERVKSLIRFSV